METTQIHCWKKVVSLIIGLWAKTIAVNSQKNNSQKSNSQKSNSPNNDSQNNNSQSTISIITAIDNSRLYVTVMISQSTEKLLNLSKQDVMKETDFDLKKCVIWTTKVEFNLNLYVHLCIIPILVTPCIIMYFYSCLIPILVTPCIISIYIYSDPCNSMHYFLFMHYFDVYRPASSIAAVLPRSTYW